MTNKFIEAFERGLEIRTRDGKSKVILIRYLDIELREEYMDGESLEIVREFYDGAWNHDYYHEDGKWKITEESDEDLILPKRKGWIAYSDLITSHIRATKESALVSLVSLKYALPNVTIKDELVVKYIEVELDD